MHLHMGCSALKKPLKGARLSPGFADTHSQLHDIEMIVESDLYLQMVLYYLGTRQVQENEHG